MKRHELEHILRAAASIAGETDLVVIGSQAILALKSPLPPDCLVSQEADLYPREAVHKAELIDGSIGEGSPFHETFGYYAHGVGPESAVLAPDWQDRVLVIENENTQPARGLCLHPVDLCISKLAAGRPKDLSFVQALIHAGLVNAKDIEQIAQDLTEQNRQHVIQRLSHL